MSILHKNGSKLASTLPILLGIALSIYLIHTITSPVLIQSDEGIASIRFYISTPLWYGDCVPVQWEVEHIGGVYLNGLARIGHAADVSCRDNGDLPVLTIQFVDGSLHTFGPNTILAIREKLVLAFIAAILLLVIRISGANLDDRIGGVSRMAWFVAIGIMGIIGALIPHETLEPLAMLIDSVYKSSFSVFHIADKFSALFPLACLITALYWFVIPVRARVAFLFASSLLMLLLLGASPEFELLVVVLVLVTYAVSSQEAGQLTTNAPVSDRRGQAGKIVAVFYLLLIEIVVLISALWGSLRASLSNTLVVVSLFLLSFLMLLLTTHKSPATNLKLSIRIPKLHYTPLQIAFAILSASVAAAYLPGGLRLLSAEYALIMELFYFGAFVLVTIRILRDGRTLLQRRVLGYATICAILLAFLAGKWPVFRVDTNFLGWIGFSYLAFRLLQVLLDSFNNRFADASLLEMLTYALFYPALLIGPIDRLPRFLKDLRQTDRQFSLNYIVAGFTRIAIGVTKKFFVADMLLAPLALGITLPLPFNSESAWTQIFAYSFYILFDFSGYVDIALGIAYLVGFTLPENFESPYLKVNISQFWQAWHITLSNWLRTYIFLPLSGRLIRTRLRQHPNLIIFVGQMTTMVLIGLWHGLTMNFLMWGLWHGIGLFLHKIYSDRAKPHVAHLTEYPVIHLLYTITSWALTFTFVSLSWVFFALPNLAATGHVFQTLFNIR